MAAIEHRHRQQIEHPQADTHHRQEFEKVHQPVAGRAAGRVGDRQRPAEIVHRGPAAEDAADDLEGQPGIVRRARHRAAQGGQRPQAVIDPVAGRLGLGERPVDRADAPDGALAQAARGRDQLDLPERAVTRDQQMDGLSRMGLHIGDPVAPVGHGLPVGGHDAVAGTQPGLGRRLARQHLAEHRRHPGPVGRDADPLEHVGLLAHIAQGPRGQDVLDRSAVGAPYPDPHRPARDRGLGQRLHHHAPDGRGLAVDRLDLLAGAESRLGRHTARRHLAHQGAHPGLAQHEHRPQRQHGEQQIEQRPGHHHRRAHPQRLPVEGAMGLGRVHLALALVQHLDVSAQGDGGEHVFRLIGRALAPPQGATEADGETQHPDPEAAGHPEVAELVHADQDPDRDRKGEQFDDEGFHEND